MKSLITSIILRFFCLLVLPVFCNAQSFAWQYEIGNNNTMGGNDLILTNDSTILIGGSFAGTVDFNPGTGITNLITPGGSQAFIASYNSKGVLKQAQKLNTGNIVSIDQDKQGNRVYASESVMSYEGQTSWTAYISVINKVRIDSKGNVWVAGFYSENEVDHFLKKYDQTGTLLLDLRLDINNRTQVGSTTYSKETRCFMELDSKDNIYLTGCYDQNFDIDPSAQVSIITHTFPGSTDYLDTDVYLAKYDENGKLLWAKGFGRLNRYTEVKGIAVNKNDEVYTTGTSGSGLIFNGENQNNSASGTTFITHHSSFGNLLKAFSPTLAAVSGLTTEQYDIKVDSLGNIYWAGQIFGAANASPYKCSPLIMETRSMVILKYSAAYDFRWATYISMKTDAELRSYKNYLNLALDKNLNIYYSGIHDYSTSVANKYIFGKIIQPSKDPYCQGTSAIIGSNSVQDVCPGGQADLHVSNLSQVLWFASECATEPLKDSIGFKPVNITKDTTFYVVDKICSLNRLPVLVKLKDNCVITTLENQSSVNTQERLYPNPVKENDHVTFQGNSPIESIIIMSLTGEPLSIQNMQKDNLLSVSGFKKGVYLARVLYQTGTVKIEKLILE